MPADSPAKTPESPPKSDGASQSGKTPEKGGYPQKRDGYLPDIHRALPQSLDAEKGDMLGGHL